MGSSAAATAAGVPSPTPSGVPGSASTVGNLISSSAQNGGTADSPALSPVQSGLSLSGNPSSVSGSGLGVSSGGITDPNPNASVSPGDSAGGVGSILGTLGDMLYSSGTGRANSNEHNAMFGRNLSSTGGEEKTQTADFGSASDGASAMAGIDPDDYFTRINLKDNLFLIVTKRYHNVNLGWQTGLVLVH
jgi:hypothetical protein